jgi:hypothetical protein
MKFTIDRSKWLRGEGQENSYLLRERDGKMCCLGMFGLACGLETEQIKEIAAPCLVPTDGGPAASFWVKKNAAASFLFDEEDENSRACGELMSINDALEIDREAREEKIVEIFAKNGITVEFVGE